MRIGAVLLSTLLTALVAGSGRGDVIFNSFDGLNQTANSFTTTGSTPRNYMADDFSTIAAPQNQAWRVDSLGMRVFVAGSGIAGQNVVYNNVTMRIRLYETFNPTAAANTSVFSSLVSDVTWNLGNITNTSTTGGGQFLTYNSLDYLGNGFDFVLQSGQNMGIAVELLSNGTANQGLATLLRAIAGDPGLPSIGTSSNGWYRDSDADGIIEASDRRTLTGLNSNLHFVINATAVPEPASLALLAVGIAGVGFQRFKKRKK